MIAIKTNRIVLPEGIKKGAVIIDSGVIVDIVDELSDNNNYYVVDVGNHLLMPGVIDPHVHINEPGRTDWEGFNTATRAAIAGGLTTLVDMPLNSSPVTTTVAAFDEKIVVTTNKLHTNVGFWGGVIPGNENEIEGLIKRGVLGFKTFLTHSGIDEFPNATEEDLCKAMPIIARYNLPLLVHCELTDNEQRATGDVHSYQNYLSSRPKKWEDDAIAMMIRLCEKFNCRVHIVHLSSADSIAQIVAAKQKGLPISVETGQHYLYFAAEEIPDRQTQYKCAPPIREKENNDQLWAALKNGVIDFVATDHSPATPDLKELQSGNFMKAWGGIASLQFALPVLLTAAKKRNYAITDVVKWLCENPAKLIDKQNTKGKITKGFDADLIVVDDENTFIVTEKIIQHKHKVTPYLNEELYGIVKRTFLGGIEVYKDGNFTALNEGKIIVH
ncbi:allantoinase AllB [Ferruginibacter lapsinanis]|uniref:allantoinase AllB n=1 Tax=Ferruginibacter lapsinanis TaxID=563172 RepID=UPI001E54D487|nr:allantoinase AllB [Ferruginibacter lapsinanis]UEG48710.1 allantoinase AllB [Ferruginibacter lapsinanis]